MSTLQERMREALDDAGITKTDLWKACKLTSGTVSNWVNGPTQTIKGNNLLTASRVLDVNPEWLSSGKGPKRIQREQSNAEPAPQLGEFRKLGVVGTAQLGDDGYWAELEYPVGHGDGYVRHSTRDENAYALRCKGDSMKPRIKNGEYVVIEPGHIPVSGDEVMVKCKEGRVMVKELLYIRDGNVHLGSVNEAHAKITIPLEDIDAMQYVGAIVKSSYWEPD